MYANYKLLPIAPGIFKALAWIGVFLGVISASAIFAGGGMPEIPRWMGLIYLVSAAFYFFFFMLASEGIRLLLEIKEKIK